MSKIYEIREEKVMIDRDLAELYGVETKRLKEAVRRNINRFPEDFMFEMDKGVPELEDAKCDLQIRPKRTAIRSVLFYRARRCNAVKCFEQQTSHCRQYHNCKDIYQNAQNAPYPQRPSHPNGRNPQECDWTGRENRSHFQLPATVCKTAGNTKNVY